MNAPHPLAVAGESRAIAEWYERRAEMLHKRAEIKPKTGGRDLHPLVFDGNVYPDVFAGEIHRTWAAFYSGDKRALEGRVAILRLNRAALAAAAASPERPQGTKSTATAQLAALALVDLHLGMLGLGTSQDQAAPDAAAAFQRSASLLDPQCTPRLHALARLGALEALARQGPPSEEMMMEASRQLAALPPHENLPVYCVGARHFAAVLDGYLEDESNGAKRKYFDISTESTKKMCNT